MDLVYLAVVEGTEGDFSAFTPDVVGANGQGETLEEVLASLAQSLAIMLEDLRERGLDHPTPSSRDSLDISEFEPEEPYQITTVSPAAFNPISAAIAQGLKDSGISKAELARRMGVKPPFVTRIIDRFYWGHSSDTLRKVADALGAEMQVSFKRSRRRSGARTRDVATR